MVALAEDKKRIMEGGPDLHLQAYPLLANAVIHSGAAVCVLAAGLARPVAASLTSPEFVGFAVESADQTKGDSHVTVRMRGVIIVRTITGATGAGNIGTSVYMSDDGTGFTTTATNNVLIGKIANFVDGEFRVAFEADALRSL